MHALWILQMLGTYTGLAIISYADDTCHCLVCISEASTMSF